MIPPRLSATNQPLDTSTNKSQIADRFGQAASIYHQSATVQQAGAKHLISFTQKNGFQLPQGNLLEIGCGTGFLTQELVNRFRDRAILITDLSSEMLAFCQFHLSLPPGENRVKFQQLDGEQLPLPEKPYALIASGFALQWFDRPLQTIDRWIKATQPGGWLLISFPTDRSFPEWRHVCQELNLPLTLNPLPNADALLETLQTLPVRCLTNEMISQTFHTDAIDFLRSLKTIGAGSSLTGKQLTIRQLKQLSAAWKLQNSNANHVRNYDKIIASHSIAYWAIQRLD
ncbi:methyltransferase domain-containing protein [Leptolyngbya ohadii]|uniref:methyltransferase domain-containing protein n=1 Tax=Leptolyngbya ohadii TaxID=1962290 RepID=UPI000B59D826|nr:methyltransferase domain-containing protein [Leptolyngbya ohadii]